jgi:UDP-2,3-diacylglucosamine pyrophosphatase LpxH
MIDDLKPERIFLNGDIVDFYAISRFNKCPKRELEMQDEIDATSAFLHTLRAVAADADIDFIEGNHEGRLSAYVNDSNRRAMSSLRCLTVPELLGLDSLGINYIESRGRTAFTTDGLVKVGHFNRVSKFSAYTGKLLLDQFMCSLVQGHTHKLGTHFRTVAGSGTYVAAEGGCLCDLDPEYANAPDWQHGVTIISRLNGSERFHIQQVPIIDHEAFFDGKRYSG